MRCVYFVIFLEWCNHRPNRRITIGKFDSSCQYRYAVFLSYGYVASAIYYVMFSRYQDTTPNLIIRDSDTIAVDAYGRAGFHSLSLGGSSQPPSPRWVEASV